MSINALDKLISISGSNFVCDKLQFFLVQLLHRSCPSKQPHLQRTKLCELKDGDLDPVYVKKRDQLKQLVVSVIRPKVVQGKFLNGKEFVSFLEQVRCSTQPILFVL